MSLKEIGLHAQHILTILIKYSQHNNVWRLLGHLMAPTTLALKIIATKGELKMFHTLLLDSHITFLDSKKVLPLKPRFIIMGNKKN